jgi:hypothetical protein
MLQIFHQRFQIAACWGPTNTHLKQQWLRDSQSDFNSNVFCLDMKITKGWILLFAAAARELLETEKSFRVDDEK